MGRLNYLGQHKRLGTAAEKMMRCLDRVGAGYQSLNQKSILVHHAGKTGTSRGSSRRHDSLDTVMKLERPNSYSQSDGSVFEVHFEKSRGFAGDAAEPIGLQHSIIEGVSCWSKFSVSDEKLEQVANLVIEGMAQTDIASALVYHREKSQKEKRAALRLALTAQIFRYS